MTGQQGLLRVEADARCATCTHRPGLLEGASYRAELYFQLTALTGSRQYSGTLAADSFCPGPIDDL